MNNESERNVHQMALLSWRCMAAVESAGAPSGGVPWQ